MMEAAANGHVAAMVQLVRCRADINLEAKCGKTALMYAAAANHANICSALVAGVRPPSFHAFNHALKKRRRLDVFISSL